MFNKLLDLIYSNKCIVCKTKINCAKPVENYGGLVCESCAKDVDNLSYNPIRIYENVKIYSAAKYSKTPKSLIGLLKFSHRKKAAKPLSQMLYNYFKNTDLNDNYIIAYPSSFFLKSAQRGYEHMYLIAKEFSKLSGFKICKNLIKKVKYTVPQYRAQDRFKNIKGAFEINKKYIEKIKDKNILIIDDITTSGATLDEIINIFLKNDIKNIVCITIAKAA